MKWSATSPRRRSRQVNAQPNPLHRTKLRAAPFTIRVAWWTAEHINRTKNAIHSSIVDFSGKWAPGTRWRSRCNERCGYSESVHTANTINNSMAAAIDEEASAAR